MKKILLVIPVYNEEKILEDSIEKLYEYMEDNIKQDWKIIIANNASIDKTQEIGEKLSKKYHKVEIYHLDFKGRGNALKHVWLNNNADVYAYCDVDLATGIEHLKELFDNISQGNNIVIASRYLKNSRTRRTLKRLFLSKGYLFLINIFFKTNLTDFQCGFKAIDNKIKREILDKIKNKEWFFDTELLLLAEQGGYKIKEIPVKWNENKDSKVNIFRTVINYIRNLIKFKDEN